MVFPRYREIFGVEGEGTPFSLARKKGVPSPSSSPTLPQNALFWSIACAGTRRPFPVLAVPRKDSVERFLFRGKGNPSAGARGGSPSPRPPSPPPARFIQAMPRSAIPFSAEQKKRGACAFQRHQPCKNTAVLPCLSVPRQDYRRENPSGDSLSFGEGKRRERRLPDAKATGEACFRNTRAGKGWGAGGSPRIFLFHLIIRMTVAGTPPTMDAGGTSRLTTAPAAMTALSPTVTPGSRIAPAPIQTLRPMVTGARL